MTLPNMQLGATEGMLDISQCLVGVGWVEVMIMVMMIMIRVIMMEVIVVVIATILNEEPVLHGQGVAACPRGWYKVCGGGGHCLFDGIWMKKRYST